MKDEYDALIRQGTWTLVSLPPTKKAIGCKWVFRLKKNSDGTIARHKARLAAKGFLQTEEEEVYMHQPIGFVDTTHPSMVCKLNKVLKTSHSITILLIYVDDILLIGSDSSYISSLITHMHSTFSMKELGLLNYFLGIAVTSSSSGYFLSQQKYATEILVKAGMTNCKSSPSPMTITSSSDPAADLPFSQPSLYRSLVGALQYLTITRPDLAFAVNHACQFLQTPLTSHFALVKRLLRYLKGTLHLGLQFSPGRLTLHAFSDSDWAGCSLDRRSTTGYCAFLGPNLISWSAKK
ncbi:uncharacterized protein LOC114283003 [Camellia sinensis]|uniref:uncharacterized protein LOC114283003 n=1 Tax=Camellia sinensis TaxID=4442 RepID=UPI0010355DC5|nr:uncharacterized protein LOC114283003 [Camellia sinensis]